MSLSGTAPSTAPSSGSPGDGTVDPPEGPLLCIVGPTATGKSELAVAVAERVGGEVVNADASQLYRGMDIGTAKLPIVQRRGVAHHLLDVLDVTEEASVAAYQAAARSAIAGIVRRGRLPILVGGSGLYVSAVLDPLVFPGTDPLVRSRLDAELAERGPAALHARLASVDPVAAAAIGAGNGRRIVRALEVVELTGEPFVATLPVTGLRPPGVTVLRTEDEPSSLDARIAARVDSMWAAGLVAEVRTLVAAGLREGRTASRALGYAQVLAMLGSADRARVEGPVDDAAGSGGAASGIGHAAGGIGGAAGGIGCADEAAARAETVRATRRFARRQRSWFARERTARRCPVGPEAVAVAVAAAEDCLRAADPPLPPDPAARVFS